MKIGNININAVKLGSTTVNKVYIGSTKVWPNTIQDFIFKINTSLGDGLSKFNFNPVHIGGSINYTIFWGDGSNTAVNTDTDSTHNYTSSGIYEIKISAVSGIRNWDFSSSIDKQKLISVDNWGTYPISLLRTFKGLLNFQLNALDLPNVINTDNSGTFEDCTNFNSSLENFPFVGTCNRALYNCSSFNNNLNIDASLCTSLILSFFNIDSFNNLFTFNSSLVTNMDSLFYGASIFNQSIGFLNLSSMPNNSNFGNFLKLTNYDNSNYQSDLIVLTGWNGSIPTKTLPTNSSIDFGTAKYENCGESEDVKNYLINTLGWTIQDGGGIGICPFTIKINTALGDGLPEFKFTPVVSGTGDFDVDWGDGNVDTNISLQTDSRLDHSYSSAGIYEIKIKSRSNLSHYNLTASPDVLKWIDVVKWGTNSTLTNYSNLFYGANSLTSISATDVPDLSNVTNFNGMLRGSAINYDFSSWDFTNGTSFTFFALSATAINSSIGGNNFSNMTLGQSFYQGVTTNTSSLANLTLGGNVSYFFYITSNFSFNTLTNVDFSNVTDATGFFDNSGLTDTDYRNFLTDLTGWNGTTATKTLQSNVKMDFDNAKFEFGGQSEDIKNYLLNTLYWTISDGGGI